MPLFYEDILVGTQVETPNRTVTQTDIGIFAALSGDANPIHTDPEVAAKSPFNKPVAQGMLCLSIATGLAWQTDLVSKAQAVFVSIAWQFVRPVFPDDTLKATLKVEEKMEAIPRRKGGEVTIKVSLFNQNNKLVGIGQWVIFFSLRPVDAVQTPGVPCETDPPGFVRQPTELPEGHAPAGTTLTGWEHTLVRRY